MDEISDIARRTLIAVADLVDVMHAAINRGSAEEASRTEGLHIAAPRATQRRGVDRRISVINVRAQIGAQLQLDEAEQRRADAFLGKQPRPRPRTRARLSTLCECGRLRRPHLIACNECLFLDFGGGVDNNAENRGGAAHHWTNALVISALRTLGPLSAPQLARMLNMDRPNMRRLLKRLVRRGRCERIEASQEFSATMYGFEPVMSDDGPRWQRLTGRFTHSDVTIARPYTFKKDVHLYKLTDLRRNSR
jgi:hypothetical protein